MKNTLNNILIFAAGLGIGSVVSWKLLKTRYEQIVQEEIASIREAFATEQSTDEAKAEVQDEYEDTVTHPSEQKLADYTEYCNIIAESGYTNGEKGGTELMEGIKPRVISPEEYGEVENYEQVSLTYYADGILAYEYYDNELDEIAYDVIDDVENTVGEDSLSHFGEYEDDSVHVRNDRLECDYEILKDYRKFSDLVSKPEDEQ